MTSGNLSGEPQVIGNAEARAKLGAFVDGFVMHDRDIARRLDDSVERAAPRMVLRRARGGSREPCRCRRDSRMRRRCWRWVARSRRRSV